MTYFKVLSIAYVHIPECKRTKLDDKSKKFVFIGVSEESKVYRLYNPDSEKVLVRRVVVFDEDLSWDWDKSHKESVLVDLDWGENEIFPREAIPNGNGNEAETSATSETIDTREINGEEGGTSSSDEDR